MRWIVVLGMACALTAGCAGGRGEGENGGALAGTKWRLTGWSASSSDPSRFTITADFSASQVSGTSAVNSYGGPCSATTGGAFSVGDLQSTLMGGSEDAMHAESLYFLLLRQARKYSLTPTTLILKDAGGQDLLVFSPR
jgi:heat shock protein HslJ